MKLDPTNRYIVHINPQAAGYSQRQVGDLYRSIEERFHAVPGIDKVGICTYTPMEDNNDSWSAVVQGKPDTEISSSMVKANAEYFDSVGTHVLMGRGIVAQDTANSTPVAVVNQSFVKKLFKPGENSIGQHFGGGPKHSSDFEIVGIVDDTAYTTVRWKDHAMAFYPFVQRSPSDKTPIEKDEMMYAGAVVLKTDRPINDMEALARRTLSAINSNLSVVKFQSFSAQIADQFAQERMLARLTMLFAALALLLATIGLYGVTAYTVARRTPEIGIRMALGAERTGVTAMVMRTAMIQAMVGLILGIPVALASVRFIKSQLFEINGVTPGLLAAAIVVLALAATLAGLIPARRAASVDPAQALRME
jgi:predicted permease